MLLAPGGMVQPLSKCWRRSNLKNEVEVGRTVGPVVLGSELRPLSGLGAATYPNDAFTSCPLGLLLHISPRQVIRTTTKCCKLLQLLNMSDNSAIERRVQAIHLHLSPASAASMQGLDRANTSSGQQSLWQDIPEVRRIGCCLGA